MMNCPCSPKSPFAAACAKAAGARVNTARDAATALNVRFMACGLLSGAESRPGDARKSRSRRDAIQHQRTRRGDGGRRDHERRAHAIEDPGSPCVAFLPHMDTREG